MLGIILTAKTKEEIYNSLDNPDLFLDKQKGGSKRTRGTDALLYIYIYIYIYI